MKTQPNRFKTGALCGVRQISYVATLVFLLSSQTSHAGSATWNLNPTSGNWNTAANWTPNTVPNGPADTATFDISNTTDLSLTGVIEVDSIVFNPGASPFKIDSISTAVLTIGGAGITNDSGIIQQFVVDENENGDSDGLRFTNSATAGRNTMLTAMPGVTSDFGTGGAILFQDESSAGDSVIQVFGASPSAFRNGELTFFDNSTAADAVISTLGFGGGAVGQLTFFGASTAGNARINNRRSGSVGGFFYFWSTATAGTSQITNLGYIVFRDSASLDQGTITNIPNSTNGFYTGSVNFWLTSTAGAGTIVNQGGTAAGTNGAATHLTDRSTAGSATLIAEAGSNGGGGGLITFDYTSDGDQARVETFGNGSLDISGHSLLGVTIGSLEGDGVVSLGANSLTIGSSNLSTTFSGVIQDAGSVTKIGTGRLAISGANTYTGGTTIQAGQLAVNNTSGSGTGTGAVSVNAGTLSGRGTIAGAVVVGTGTGAGAVLAPGANRTGTLAIQSRIIFKADATYTYTLNTRRARADEVIANEVRINPGASFSVVGVGNRPLAAGTLFTAISNTATSAISGTFTNLPDGGTITIGRNTFRADYQRGDGNDLTLTVVP